MENSTACQYVQGPGLEVHEADDGLIVFNTATDKVHHLNPSAGILFELCHQAHSIEDVAQSMAQLYQLDELPLDEAKNSVEQLVAEGVLIPTSID